MNPSTALATVVVDELVRGGVREVVLSPGSRSAPLAFALHDADAEGRLRLHVRIDERTAGFLALGLAKVSGTPVPVVTTSGTAAVNLHPAVVEAAYSGVPLVALTADRPVEMRGVGANQTIDQEQLFGRSVLAYADIEAADDAIGQVSSWRAAVARALGDARRGGPVQLNVSFREPLAPDGDGGWVEPLDAARAPASARRAATATPATTALGLGPRTVVLAGDSAGAAARILAEQGGWPMLAEPTSGARSGPHAIGTYRLLLDVLGPEIERVVVLGRPTLSRQVTRLLARTDVALVVVDSGNPWSQVRRPHADVVPRLAVTDATSAATGRPDDWLLRWRTADLRARDLVQAVLAGRVTGPGVAQVVASAVPPGGLLVSGSSASVRDLDLADPWTDQPPAVLANRGAAGIDGTVSTAVGAALAHGGPTHALMGDLTFLHDSTGLVIGPGEPRPDLTIVVNNDDGGGVFTTLEQGAPEHSGSFERVFGTSHGVDLAALCAASGTAYRLAVTLEELSAALRRPRPGIEVIEVRTERSDRRALDERLRAAGQAAATA